MSFTGHIMADNLNVIKQKKSNKKSWQGDKAWSLIKEGGMGNEGQTPAKHFDKPIQLSYIDQ